MTVKGEECLKAYAQSHSVFVIELSKLSGT